MSNINTYLPRSGRVLKENSEFINIADFLELQRAGSTIFNQLVNVEPTQQFVYKSVVPISTQRDRVTTSGDGAVAQVNSSEYRIRATTGVAMFQTKQKGDYIPYNILVPGLGLRTVGALTGNAKIEFGYFDFNEGIQDGTLIELNASGKYHKVYKSGAVVYSKLIEFDSVKGSIFQFPFAYYGYGFAGLDIALVDQRDQLYNVRQSTYYPSGETMMNNSNLPLTIRVTGDGTQIDALVGGRHITVLGRNDKIFRTVTETRKLQDGIGSTNYYPLLSVRLKDGFKNIFSELGSISVIANADMEVAIFLDTSLTEPTFGTPGDYTATECATEWDRVATAMTGGQQIWGDLINGGTGNRETYASIQLPDNPIMNGDTLTFAVRRITGSNGTATMTAKIRENW